MAAAILLLSSGQASSVTQKKLQNLEFFMLSKNNRDQQGAHVEDDILL